MLAQLSLSLARFVPSARHLLGSDPPGAPQAPAGAHRHHRVLRGVHARIHPQGEAPEPAWQRTGHRGQGWRRKRRGGGGAAAGGGAERPAGLASRGD